MDRYLLDSNSFITPYKNYYAFDLVPRYWDMFKAVLMRNDVALLDMVYDEIDAGNDALTEWLKQINGINILNHREPTVVSKYGEVIRYLSSSPLYSDKAVRQWASSIADPWLIATASVNDYKIITFETPNKNLNSKNPAGKPKIPDVANVFNVQCENLFYFMRKTSIYIQ
ncbi:MAG: DUF4411 family protein [Clostridiales bacterium]|nr:DUF4411 family protein [Clostridiales bacterium]